LTANKGRSKAASNQHETKATNTSITQAIARNAFLMIMLPVEIKVVV